MIAQEGVAKPPPRNRRLRTPEPEEEELAHATTPLASVPPPPSERRLAKTWARIRRPVVLVLQAAMVLGATAGAIAIGRLVRNYLHTSPHFAIETLEVAGHDRVNEEELLQTAGLATGNNIFEVSPEQATEQLLAHPWVANAVVERRLPGTLRVEVEERHAVAALSMDDGLYLVGDDATLFKAIEDGDPVDHPVVTGIARARFVGDRAYRTSVLVEVVALLHDYRMAGLWRREPISEIHIQDNDDVTLHVGSDGMEVRLGRGPFLRKLRKLRRVLDRLGDERALYVYLDNVRRPDRVTVRLREIELPPDPEATPETATES